MTKHFNIADMYEMVADKVPQATLRRAFALFLVLMAIFILVESGPRALAS